MNHFVYMLGPRLSSILFVSRCAEIVLVRLIFFPWKVREFHRLHYAIHHHSGTEAGTKSEEQHASAAIAAECLHGSVVDHVHRLAERPVKAKSLPSFAKVVRFPQRNVVHHRAWVAEGHMVEVPAIRQ